MIAGSRPNTEEGLHLSGAGMEVKQEGSGQGTTFKKKMT